MHLFKRILSEGRLIGLNLRHPARALNSFLAVLSYKFKLIKPWGKPIAVDLEPVNFCNLRCPHCQVTHWAKPKNTLSMESFRKYIKHFLGASRIKLQGMGEPFLSKEMPAIVKDLAGHDMYIEIVCNGTVMTDPIREVLTQVPQLDVHFSVDGPTKEIFEKIRVGSNFDKIMENIKSVVNTRPLKSSVGLSMVAFEESKEQIKPTLALAKKLGIKNFFLQLVVINYGQDKLNAKTVEHRIAQEKISKNEIRKTASDSNIDLTISDELYDEKHQCPWPWIGSYIDTEGNVIPCCRVANAEVCSFGNLNKEDFQTIWHNKGYQRLREQIRTNNIPTFCRSCYKASVVEKMSSAKES